MKFLKDILYGVSIESIKGSTNIKISNIVFDSRKVTNGSVFVAIKGTQFDGHNYIEKAIQSGAAVIVGENLKKFSSNSVVYISLENSRAALSIMASNFYENPSKKIKLIGITGTNGKTTVATLLYNLFQEIGYCSGLISTINIKINKKEYITTHTTPNPIEIQKILTKMVHSGVQYCFMEISSHGISQDRITGNHFAGGVFTNLTHDHLDYHSSFDEYRDTKKIFLDMLPKDAFALANKDDKNGVFMLQNTKAQKKTYGVYSYADYTAQILENQFEGMLLKIEQLDVFTKLVGKFNASNLLAVYAVGRLLGLDAVKILQYISALNGARGRFDIIRVDEIIFIIDYAHTPDALKHTLLTIEEIRTKNEKVITVIGCGGNRDKDKRPIMGRVASDFSDFVIFTSDNPRDEMPEKIITEMQKGVAEENYKKIVIDINRSRAIKKAYSIAKQKDIVLIAGKGHETYQEIKGGRSFFSDFEEVEKLYKS